MPFQTPLPESISSAEAQALARYVHDLEDRMKLVSELLEARGTRDTAVLASSITYNLRLLERRLVNPEPVIEFANAFAGTFDR